METSALIDLLLKLLRIRKIPLKKGACFSHTEKEANGLPDEPRRLDWTIIDAFMKYGTLFHSPLSEKEATKRSSLSDFPLHQEIGRGKDGDPWSLLTRFIVLILVPIANHLCGFRPGRGSIKIEIKDQASFPY